MRHSLLWRFLGLLFAAGAAPAHADSLIFSSLDPFVSSGSLAVTGPLVPISISNATDRDLAAGFVASSSGRLYAIDIPLAWCCPPNYSGGENAADLWLMSDFGGHPGAILESWHLTDLPSFPSGDLLRQRQR
jgi:hypothetical protein